MSIATRCAVVATASFLLTSTATHAGFPDCNANGIDDATDISSGTSADDNTNGIPDECEATVLHVDESASGPMFTGTSWDTAYTELQDALSVAAVSGNAAEQIWIATGTYRPDGGTIDRALSFDLVDGVALYGGFAGDEVLLGDRDPVANPTTLSGDLGAPGDSSDNSFHVVRAEDVGPSAIIDGLTITGGNANGPVDKIGGGILTFNSTPTIIDCSIIGNEAASAGGGMYLFTETVTAATMTLSDCVISGNRAGLNGGGAVCYVTNVSMTNCQFLNNFADETGDLGSGGAVWLFNGQFVANTTTFNGNIAGFGGGGLAAGAGSKVTLTNSDFEGNASGVGGGFRSFGDTTSDATGCSFTGNTASLTGGGADINGSIATFTSCTFDTNDSGQVGGGIHANSATQLRAFSCTFDGNTAGIGGGGINTDTAAVTGVVSSTFTGNGAADGGATRTSGATSAAVNSSFFANTASGNGGAVHDDNAATAYSNCVFAGNTSDGTAGAVNVFAGSGTLVANCTITANTGMSGGGVVVNNASLTVVNSILWQNSDKSGTGEAAQLSASVSGTLTVDWSDVQGLTGSLGGAGNIDTNPRFIDPLGLDDQPGTGDEDYALRDASACIDAADNALVAPDFLDIDGDGDFGEPTPLDHDDNDRFVDDAGVTDTGPSAPPVVDIGAFEFQDWSCPQDIDNDDFVGFSDLTALLSAWGPCSRCPEDIDHDDNVAFSDLTSLLNAWGDCPE